MRFHVVMQVDSWVYIIHLALAVLAILVAISLFCVWCEDDGQGLSPEKEMSSLVWTCPLCDHKNERSHTKYQNYGTSL